MKKIIGLTTAMVIVLGVNAQAQWDTKGSIDLDVVLRIAGISFLIYLIGNILLTFLKIVLNHRLKGKMIEKGASDSVVAQLLQTDQKTNKFTALKWSVVLGSIGIGLLLVQQFPPFGIHSLAILSFCVSAAFLAYYFLIKRTDDQKV
jgi:Na+-transporting NADH:ubiquinone oxidoreductase subunit NqrB